MQARRAVGGAGAAVWGRTFGRGAVAARVGDRGLLRDDRVLSLNALFGSLDVGRVLRIAASRVVTCLFQLDQFLTDLRAGNRLMVRLGKRNDRSGRDGRHNNRLVTGIYEL